MTIGNVSEMFVPNIEMFVPNIDIDRQCRPCLVLSPSQFPSSHSEIPALTNDCMSDVQWFSLEPWEHLI